MEYVEQFAESPYNGYVLYGPYFHSSLERYVVRLKHQESELYTTYARYLMSVHLGRILSDDEEVHHRDENKLNDTLSNLIVLTPTEHTHLHHGKIQTKAFICPNCDISFEKPLTSGFRRDRKVGKPGPFCSRSCAAKYSLRV